MRDTPEPAASSPRTSDSVTGRGRVPPDAGKRAAVLGSPIHHSLSPALHRAAYAELRLDWSYDALECDEQRLPGLLDELDDSWAGLSLTMPLKRTVLPLLDRVSDLASAVGAANTVVFADGRRHGDNTDVGGILDTLRDHGVRVARAPVVLGAGATACSALAACRELGAWDVFVVARDPARTVTVREVAERLGVRVQIRTFDDLARLLPAEVLVSTLPAGAADGVARLMGGVVSPSGAAGQDGGHFGEEADPEGRDLAGRPVVLDVCYDPWPTPLGTAASAAGYTVASGFQMLLHQAVRQVVLMTGRHDVPVEAMRAAGERVLADRASAPS